MKIIDKRMRGPWEVAYRCSHCDLLLSFREVMDNDGVCPYCAFIGDGTVVDCAKIARRKVYDLYAPVWMFWVKSIWTWEYNCKKKNDNV